MQARIADALWMLARQWQTGEFRGEDAASPIQARFEHETTPVSAMRSHQPDAPYIPIDPTVPLEAYVEQQPPAQLAGFRRSAEAGTHLLRMLSAGGFHDLRGAIREEFPLAVPERSTLGERAWINLLMRRACDGEGIYHDPAPLQAIVHDRVAPGSLDDFRAIILAWRHWYEDRIFSAPNHDCWMPDRMEYRFEMRALTDDGAMTLSAKEYPGGHLDWYNFDLKKGAADHGGKTTRHEAREVLPAPVQFAGMPASRWWQFEDGTINFGDINSASVDFARMITAAFAAGFGDDYYVIPIKVPIGSLAQVTRLEVRDAFGETTVVRSVAAMDGLGKRVWRFFELKGDAGQPHLYVPAVALGRIEGKAIESVTLIRDETENIAWGVENTYEGALERLIDRQQQWATVRAEAIPDETIAENTWKYRLLNRIPPHWIPFLPMRTGDNAQVQLRRGRMAEWELLPEHLDLVGVRGQTLLPSSAAPLYIHEEEVPMSGVEITRSYQFARDVSGRSFVWVGRRKRPAGVLTPLARDTDDVKINAGD